MVFAGGLQFYGYARLQAWRGHGNHPDEAPYVHRRRHWAHVFFAPARLSLLRRYLEDFDDHHHSLAALHAGFWKQHQRSKSVGYYPNHQPNVPDLGYGE